MFAFSFRARSKALRQISRKVENIHLNIHPTRRQNSSLGNFIVDKILLDCVGTGWALCSLPKTVAHLSTAFKEGEDSLLLLIPGSLLWLARALVSVASVRERPTGWMNGCERRASEAGEGGE